MWSSRVTALLTASSLVLAACGGGDSAGSPNPQPPPTPNPPPSVFTPPAQESLSVTDVERILAQAIEEAAARGKPSTIAVTDRVGNVLAIYRMTGAPAALVVQSPAGSRPANPTGNVLKTDLEALVVPGDLTAFGVDPAAPAIAAAAIAKAITGAYLSSSGNAFSTRTASQIVQQHFPPSPAAVGLESGPLFGVQFSQLPCSDLSARYLPAGGTAAFIGPKRSPLGLSADPGGIPLYKNGVVVGGLGVMSDSLYSYDTNILDVDADDDEFIAIAGATGFDAPEGVRANRITVDGTSLRYLDATPAGLASNPAAARAFAALNGVTGGYFALKGYFAETGPATAIAGRAYGAEASGIRKATTAEFNNPDAFILTDGAGANRFPIRAATDAGDVAQPITQAEAAALLEEAFKVLSAARAQIRQPLDSRAQVTVSLVDTRGAILGVVRSPDAPIFGTDVSLQKARTAMFFSHPQAAANLLATADPLVGTVPFLTDSRAYVGASRTFFNNPNAFTGQIAFADRSIGNIARPYYPDGEVARANGPLSQPFASWSPFSTGLQTSLILSNVALHLLYILGAAPTDTPQRCTFLPDNGGGINRLQNGIQIFPGSVPVYRGNTLIGGLGVSGDGIDQDDMISFLGAHNAGQRVGGIGNAPAAIRADTVVIPVGAGQARLRYVGCPFAPFIGSSEQNVCQGK